MSRHGYWLLMWWTTSSSAACARAGARPRKARATRPSVTPASARAAGSRSATATAYARPTRARSPSSTPPPAGACASACRSSRATTSSALRIVSYSHRPDQQGHHRRPRPAPLHPRRR
ncbi:hypothetical protein PVAP13_2KG307902 [Panicum virgatum]|uniref:Secreted protein n=1 Tax=Panicum virgatum TaxID=38727 RepID=A0A8T0W2D8_PANVG|nr:hypothetical protein PVAP13_2KG307902 [Panicum virgatum]